MPRRPFQPIPNTQKVEIIGHDIGDNRPNVCVFHTYGASGYTAANQIAQAADWDAFLHNMSGYTNGEVQWDEIRITDLNSATGPQSTVATTRGGSGADFPPGMCVVWFQHTALRGRSYTGRTFWPCGDNGFNYANGQVSSAYIGDITTQWTALETALAAETPASHVVVASRKLLVSTQVTSITVRPEIGRIRRRAFG